MIEVWAWYRPVGSAAGLQRFACSDLAEARWMVKNLLANGWERAEIHGLERAYYPDKI